MAGKHRHLHKDLATQSQAGGRFFGIHENQASGFGRAGSPKVPALPYGRATEQAEAQVGSPGVSKG
ncbi:MAG: hypothetical protein L0312_32165, partial [Acidobacteria bacterium]|nr:hypothetical protein [Acidobacteriota bacterium]